MKSFWPMWFKKETAQQQAIDTHEEAQRNLLKSQDAAAYHAKMAEYYEETVNRLATYIRTHQQ